MFALAALICFILALFKVKVDIDLVTMGLVFIAAHLLLGGWILGQWNSRQPQ